MVRDPDPRHPGESKWGGDRCGDTYENPTLGPSVEEGVEPGVSTGPVPQ